MSLINDALKRAKQAQQSNPVPAPELPFRPADPSQRRNPGPPLLLTVAVVCVLALVVLLAVLAFQKRDTIPSVANARQSSQSPLQASTPAATAPTANPVPAGQSTSRQPNANPATAPLLATIESALPTNSVASSASTDAATNMTIASELSKPAAPKLQGIFYHPARPSAVISGKTVFIGSRVGEFQVLAITQENVAIGSATQTNVLTLAE